MHGKYHLQVLSLPIPEKQLRQQPAAKTAISPAKR
jgi:hypothetical protein